MLANLHGVALRRVASSNDTGSGYPERALTLKNDHSRRLGYAVLGVNYIGV
jgi:hypothetical protein